jgi:TetR/AcrR family transcriptional repressor of bet genes
MKTSIEKVRRRDLVEAAFQTFLDHGISGTTVARIGQQAGMSHGIVNYYFKSKDQLLSAVIRHAFRLITREIVRLLKAAETPRGRVSAVIAGNFMGELFNRETAAAWISFYAEVAANPEFERLQDMFYRRLQSNLMDALGQLTDPPAAEQIALGVSVWIDGLWLRSAMKRQGMDRLAAIRAIERYVDTALAEAQRGSSASRQAMVAAKGGAAKPRRRP